MKKMYQSPSLLVLETQTFVLAVSGNSTVVDDKDIDEIVL